jgi:hypothetical protein
MFAIALLPAATLGDANNAAPAYVGASMRSTDVAQTTK